MKALVKFSVIAVIAMIGLILMIGEVENYDLLIFTKVLGVAAFLVDYKLFRYWENDIKKLNIE